MTISILLPTYNREKLLRRAIGSILSQSFSDFELIVINDASTDGTRAFLDELAHHDQRVIPIHHERNYYPDISRALNEALAIAHGKYIARLDDDDYWCDDDKLKKQSDFLDAYPDHAVVGGGTIVVDDADRERFRYFKLETDDLIRRRALFANPFTHSTVMFRADLARAVGGYGKFKNAEDWDLWLRMGTKGKFHNLQEYFVRYLLTENSKTVIFKRSQTREIFSLLWTRRKEYPGFPLALMVNVGQYCRAGHRMPFMSVFPARNGRHSRLERAIHPFSPGKRRWSEVHPLKAAH
jgi:glycosyltransferase involved in cell wall biosynthesis